jgi:hypothetical protein
MIILEIILVVIGLLAVGMSFRLFDYAEEGGYEDIPLDEQEEEAVRLQLDEFEDQLLAIADEQIGQASDKLSSISNDKLLGMDEYSSQVLERINKNHEEVVFLYNMLNEKEEEIKALVHHVDSVKAQIHDETALEYQKIMDILKQLKEKTDAFAEASQKKEERVISSLENTQAESLVKTAEGMRKEPEEIVEEPDDADEHKSDDGFDNHNQEIISLYQQGHSVLEISKMLSLGQGEVKFVIDLYED